MRTASQAGTQARDIGGIARVLGGGGDHRHGGRPGGEARRRRLVREDLVAKQAREPVAVARDEGPPVSTAARRRQPQSDGSGRAQGERGRESQRGDQIMWSARTARQSLRLRRVRVVRGAIGLARLRRGRIILRGKFFDHRRPRLLDLCARPQPAVQLLPAQFPVRKVRGAGSARDGRLAFAALVGYVYTWIPNLDSKYLESYERLWDVWHRCLLSCLRTQSVEYLPPVVYANF